MRSDAPTRKIWIFSWYRERVMFFLTGKESLLKSKIPSFPRFPRRRGDKLLRLKEITPTRKIMEPRYTASGGYAVPFYVVRISAESLTEN